jgi:hypothetical protein
VRRLARFFLLPLPEQRYLVEAVVCLGAARLLLFLPFRWLVRLMGRPQAAANCSGAALESGGSSTAFAVRLALLRAAGGLPWPSSCLARALAARMMLSRRRMPSVLQLGVRTGITIELSAHAWLKCGEIDVIGTECAAEFTPIAVFHA